MDKVFSILVQGMLITIVGVGLGCAITVGGLMIGVYIVNGTPYAPAAFIGGLMIAGCTVGAYVMGSFMSGGDMLPPKHTLHPMVFIGLLGIGIPMAVYALKVIQ